MIGKSHLKLSVFIFILITLTLSSCSKKEPVKPEVRAVERWNALIKKDWGKAYSYESPAYRKNYTLDQYKDRYGNMVIWKKIRLLRSKQIDKKIIKVTLDLTVLFHPPGGGKMLIPGAINERWSLINNKWWYIPRKK